MKIARTLAIAAALLVVAYGALYFAMAERVEVVVLHHHGAEAGDVKTVRVWVVDDAGHAWLRTGAANASWLPRLRAHPQVELERGGATTPFTAVVLEDPPTLARIDELSLQKYGWSEQLLRKLSGANAKHVAIRLDPR